MSRRVVVADGSIFVRNLIRMFLSKENLQLTLVEDGLAAISATFALIPALVIADAALRRKDGYAVCEAIKNEPETRGVPVLLMIDAARPFDEARARAAKVDDHIDKPLHGEQLIAKVTALMQRGG